MLELFKKNTFFSILLLIPYAIVLHASAWFSQITYKNSENCWIYNQIFKNQWLSYSTETMIAIAMIAIQAIIIGRMVSSYKMNSEGQLFGGLFFILFCGFHPSTLSLNPVLFANLFFTVGLYQLFGIYLKKTATTQLFNFGFLVGLASLFYTPYYIYLLLGVIGIVILRGSKPKEFLQIIGGFINIYFLAYVILYIFNLHLEFWDQQITGFFSPFIFSFKFSSYGWVAFTLLLLFLILILFQYPYFQFKRTMMVQKQFDILFWCLLVGLWSTLFLKIEQVNHLMVLFTPLALLTGLLLTKLKNPLIQETIHLFLVIVSLFLQFQNW
ncbi:MAG: hypothetical protein IPO86_05545 [Saprospiraceae bacterium]|nr:hypothetical protein [Saprospiraceae bacterium]